LLFGESGDNGETHWTGGIDEVQISTTPRTTGWVVTEYNNQSSPSAFTPTYTGTSPESAPTRTAGTAGIAIGNRSSSSIGWYSTGGTWEL